MKKIKEIISGQKRKVVMLATTGALTVGSAMSAFAAESSGSIDVAGGMTTALNSFVSDYGLVVLAILPIGLAAFGATFAVKKGLNF